MKRIALVTTLVAVAVLLGGIALVPSLYSDNDVIELDILFTSDIHGHIDRNFATFLNPNFPPPLGGGASAMTYIKRAREEAAAGGRELLFFDSGDIFQGTPVGMKTKGTTVVKWMNAAGYDAMALGNHEFDHGWENVKRLVELAEFPMLAANLYSAETGKKVDWVGDMLLIEKGDLTIGVVGYVTESTVNMAFSKHVEGLEFKPIHELMPGHAKELRERGADLVFVLMHSGLPYKPEMEKNYRLMKEREAEDGLPHWGMNAMELAHTIWGVDAIFGGHTHQGYDTPWEDPRTHTLVFEPYANGSSIGHVTLKIDRETKQVLGFDTHFGRGALLTLFEEETWPDPVSADTINVWVADAEGGLDEVVGETTVLLQRGSPNNALMGFVIADAFREIMEVDFAIQNTGGVRADISPGRITRKDLVAVEPFGNAMVVLDLTGAEMKELLEDKLRGRGGGIFFSGGKIHYDLEREEGDRIIQFNVNDEPIDLNKEYRLAMTDYLAQGNSGMYRFRDMDPDRFFFSGQMAREVIAEYIRRYGVISPKNDGRWVKVKSSS